MMILEEGRILKSIGCEAVHIGEEGRKDTNVEEAEGSAGWKREITGEKG